VHPAISALLSPYFTTLANPRWFSINFGLGDRAQSSGCDKRVSCEDDTDVCQIQYTTWEEGLEEAIRNSGFSFVG
jgi:hypothetical protein